jgi:ribose 5-phosphate isomerase B
MRIALGADTAGKPLLDVVAAHLRTKAGFVVTDLNSPEFYADVADRVARSVLDGTNDRAVLFCGTGIGVCISANKVPGVRAALTHDTYSAERAAKSNNAQIITMGARVIGPELAKAIADAYLAADFDPNGSSAGNVDAIGRIDQKYGRAP